MVTNQFHIPNAAEKCLGIHYIGDIDMAKALLGAVGDPEFKAA